MNEIRQLGSVEKLLLYLKLPEKVKIFQTFCATNEYSYVTFCEFCKRLKAIYNPPSRRTGPRDCSVPTYFGIRYRETILDFGPPDLSIFRRGKRSQSAVNGNETEDKNISNNNYSNNNNNSNNYNNNNNDSNKKDINDTNIHESQTIYCSKNSLSDGVNSINNNVNNNYCSNDKKANGNKPPGNNDDDHMSDNDYDLDDEKDDDDDEDDDDCMDGGDDGDDDDVEMMMKWNHVVKLSSKNVILSWAAKIIADDSVKFLKYRHLAEYLVMNKLVDENTKDFLVLQSSMKKQINTPPSTANSAPEASHLSTTKKKLHDTLVQKCQLIKQKNRASNQESSFHQCTQQCAQQCTHQRVHQGLNQTQQIMMFQPQRQQQQQKTTNTATSHSNSTHHNHSSRQKCQGTSLKVRSFSSADCKVKKFDDSSKSTKAATTTASNQLKRPASAAQHKFLLPKMLKMEDAVVGSSNPTAPTNNQPMLLMLSTPVKNGTTANMTPMFLAVAPNSATVSNIFLPQQLQHLQQVLLQQQQLQTVQPQHQPLQQPQLQQQPKHQKVPTHQQKIQQQQIPQQPLFQQVQQQQQQQIQQPQQRKLKQQQPLLQQLQPIRQPQQQQQLTQQQLTQQQLTQQQLTPQQLTQLQQQLQQQNANAQKPHTFPNNFRLILATKPSDDNKMKPIQVHTHKIPLKEESLDSSNLKPAAVELTTSSASPSSVFEKLNKGSQFIKSVLNGAAKDPFGSNAKHSSDPNAPIQQFVTLKKGNNNPAISVGDPTDINNKTSYANTSNFIQMKPLRSYSRHPFSNVTISKLLGMNQPSQNSSNYIATGSVTSLPLANKNITNNNFSKLPIGNRKTVISLVKLTPITMVITRRDHSSMRVHPFLI
ncbi:hypothetical protein HELRODRAFT_174883 [Helobdella robusta]|uniref:Uncharacterized protein n=1 Tax=Helobdella robusta TaxID=6412 RepID=T1F8K6_HELRO|nr:hypothetical protein HELRODRAFT_174883 [Helobdella robusta]ESO01329.1 hypothetical protein HELRODRAFT_174883 [Helobdella robusta]